MTFEHLTKEVLVEVFARRSIEVKEVLQVETKEKESWMTSIHEYLLSGLLLEDPKESRKIKIKAPQYKLIKCSLYNNFNTEPRSMVVRITKQGYYWPSMHRDVSRIIQDCEKYKEKSVVKKRAEIEAIAAGNAWPFGVPQIFSSKNDKHFKEGIFADLCKGLKITQSFSLITEHMEIMSRIEKQLARSQQGWVDDLSQRKNKVSDKKKESKEVASVEKAYYQNEMRRYHSKRNSPSNYKVGDFVMQLQNNTENPQVWQGPHMIREVHERELYKIIDASNHSLIQTTKGTNLHKF
ncbi:hypothetical protein Tco_0630595 [Tanacetum coccineum]